MVVINKTREDTYENANVLLLLVRQSRCRLRHSARCKLDRPRGHAPMHTNSVCKQRI